MTQIIGGVEIGTAKVVALVGEVLQGKALNIIGMGQVRSEGVKKGEILDFKLASQAVHAALAEAEKSAGTRLECVYLAQTGNHLRGHLNTGMVNVSASNSTVSRLDIKRVQENAKSKQLASDYVYIHHIKHPYKLDGRIVKDPYMMEGERLEVSYWSVHGDTQKVRDTIHIINGFGLKVEDMILSSIASAAIVATDTEKKNGVLVLDIGCGTTDYALYKDGYIVRTGVIPVGGDHITNDLSLGLRIGLENAEKIKQEYAKAVVDAADAEESILLMPSKNGVDRRVQRQSIYKIVHARVQELIQVIARQLEPWISYHSLPGGVVLTGGTSRLVGIEALVRQELGLEVRLGQNPDWANSTLRAPEYSTTLGLLHYALSDKKADPLDLSEELHPSVLDKMVKLFKV